VFTCLSNSTWNSLYFARTFVIFNVLLQVFSHSLILQFFVLLLVLQVATISPMHSPHSYCNTHHKSKSRFGITLNVKKLGGHSLPFFHLRQLVVFALIIIFQPPHSFHDGFILICPHGNNYHWLGCIIIFFIHPNVIVTISTSSFIIFAMCAVICSNSIISSSDLSAKLTDFVGESSKLYMVLITKLPLLIYGHHGIVSSSSSSYVSLSSWTPFHG